MLPLSKSKPKILAVVENSMTRVPRILFLFVFSWMACNNIVAQQRQTVQLAGLQPSQHLVLWRVSPTPEKPDGPVLYQLLFNASGTPGTLPVFDTNPRHLVNSDIKDAGGIVSIGGSGFMIDANSGVVTFVNAQTFPGTGISGIVGVTNGGTGLSSAGTAGSFLRSDGSVWASSAIQIGDVPSLSAAYVDLTTVQSVGGLKTFTDTMTAFGANTTAAVGRPGGQFKGGIVFSLSPIAGGAGVVATGADEVGTTAGAGAVGHGGNIFNGAGQLAGDGGQFTGGDITTGTGTGGTGVVARAGGAGGKILSGLDATGSEAFAVSGNGDVTLGGRISLGIYIISYLPTSVPYDAPCSDPSDIAISGGAFTATALSLRESRPSGEILPGQKGPAPNAWRVTCTNGTMDVACLRAYVVCLTHASQ
jgi:hypothetical protein